MFAIVQTNKKTEWQKIQQTRKMGRKDSSQKAPSFLTLVLTKPKLWKRIDRPKQTKSLSQTKLNQTFKVELSKWNFIWFWCGTIHGHTCNLPPLSLLMVRSDDQIITRTHQFDVKFGYMYDPKFFVLLKKLDGIEHSSLAKR